MIKVNVGGFTLLLEAMEDNTAAKVVGLEGAGSRLSVPSFVEDGGVSLPVTAIDKKAFLSTRGLRDVEIPAGVTDIGDWALSQCIHLTNVTVEKGGRPTFQKGVFDGSERIESIHLKDFDDEDMPFLLAATVKRLPAAYLLRDKDLGTPVWYEKWDLALESFLKLDDYEGFTDRALCGEEDISYDGVGMVDGEMPGESTEYLKEVGRNKSYLCLMRLMHARNLSDKFRQTLTDYVSARGIGRGTGTAWSLFKEELKDNKEYLELYLDIVKPGTDEIDAMLRDLGDDMVQSKAYIIKAGSGADKKDSFFDDLLL
ncbi:MAG: leucine-rich repeat protein [Lachnospiraceae bacterium]|nr:leucine-rich repeat protein [Lachnospiraceae bacterium]